MVLPDGLVYFLKIEKKTSRIHQNYLMALKVTFRGSAKTPTLPFPSGQPKSTDTHSKNTRVSMTRKRVRWGQTPFRVNDDPEISQLDAKYDPELGQSDPIICQFD